MVLVLGLEVFLKAPVTAVWAICKIGRKSWQWTATTGIAVIILLCIVGTCVMVAMPKFRKLQILTDNINRVTRENLTGLRVVRAYNAEDYQETKFEKANDELKRTQLFANRTMTILMPGIMLVMNGLTLAVYWVGAYLINDAGMQDKVTFILRYDCLFTVCDAGCDGFHDAGYDLCAGTPCIRCCKAYQ